MPSDFNFLPIIPELILAIGALALVLIGVFGGQRSTGLVTILSVVLLAAAGIAVVEIPDRYVAFSGAFTFDAFARLMKLLTLLGGASLVYGFTGQTTFAGIAYALESGSPGLGLVFGLVFLIAGFAFKASAAPFHMWTPDVYEGAPTPVTAFFSAAPKIAAVALFVRFLIEPLGGLLVEWRQIIVFLSVASMILGAVAAIAQQNIKRLMAYSSIGHVGYALIGLAAATPNGIRGVLVYMAIYLFMNIGTWTVILCMRQRGQMLEGISDLSGLGRSQPGLALALAIFMFALAGIPPTAGFFSKLYIF